MYQHGYRPLRRAKRALDGSSQSAWSKLVLIFIDKVLLVLITAAAISIFQSRLQLSEKRLEKAKHISEISVDKPVSIVTELPAHLDAFVLYAEHIRYHDFEHISSERLTELQATISSDIEGSRAYYSKDQYLESWGDQIKETIKVVRAKALSKNSLGIEDLEKLEAARNLVYRFHQRIIDLSVQQAIDRFDTAYEPHRSR
jgi:hypothetical protein